jgi:hypothetical protein
MKLNSHVVFLIVIVGIITAGVVGASIMNNGSMKQVDFDGVKVSVPSNAEFIKTGDGYADSKYGITIHVFKNNASMVNYLKGINGASIVALKNQPPQSVAYVYGDDTNVLITNSVEGISIGAKDQALVADMANSVVFSNHQKSAKPHVSIPGVAPPHLEFNTDFNAMAVILAQVNTAVFNAELYQSNVSMTINDYNSYSDQGALDQYTANEYVSNVTSDSAVVSDANNNQPQSSLMDNPAVSTIVESVSSGDDGAAGDAAGSGGAVSSGPSDSGSVSAPSSSGTDSGSEPSSSDGGPEKITKEQLRTELEKELPDGYSIKKIKDEGDYYLVSIEDSSGHVEKIKYDAYTGQQLP